MNLNQVKCVLPEQEKKHAHVLPKRKKKKKPI